MQANEKPSIHYNIWIDVGTAECFEGNLGTLIEAHVKR